MLDDGMKDEIQTCLVCASQQQGSALFPGWALGLVPFGSDSSDLPQTQVQKQPRGAAAFSLCFLGLAPAPKQRQHVVPQRNHWRPLWHQEHGKGAQLVAEGVSKE